MKQKQCTGITKITGNCYERNDCTGKRKPQGNAKKTNAQSKENDCKV